METLTIYPQSRYSAILFGNILKEIYDEDKAELKEDEGSAPSKPKIYSVEIDPLIASVAMNLVSLAGLQDIVEVIVGASAHTLQRFHDEGILAETGIDLLFMDHDEALYEPDMKLAEKLAFLDKEDAVVIADNVVRPGAPEYRSYMRKNPRMSQSWGLAGLIVPGDFEVSWLATDRNHAREAQSLSIVLDIPLTLRS